VKKIKIEENLLEKISSKTKFLLESYGIPSHIVPLGGINYQILEDFYVSKDNFLVLGEYKTANSKHYLVLEFNTERLYHQWNYDLIPNNVFINSNLEKTFLCNYAYDLFVQRLIKSEALGPYYENTSKGGNFEKYASLLREIIADIDEKAAKEGAWHSLIEEMSIGTI
jgi:hypothetical protein